ncbi:NUDIX domain-containing protein [Streptomyces sp. CBMA29]|uniref:NUDIX domain-containing protein n=1 Tax=Streptomyces sp. CBMA29 TaxID=1896314 RepID=UPI002948C094|nr:NUDIX domain-containing protein [Streptomyces sp. CBMA29]MBD0734032.1 hypothetical protein [Streptomyces sp. CBMA29]
MPSVRESLIDAYALYVTAYPREMPRLRTLTSTLLYSQEDPTDPAVEPAHVTASAVLLGPDNRVLLAADLGRWVLPGGHADPEDGTLLDTARRHLAEVTGLPEHSFVTAHLHGSVPLHYHEMDVRAPDGDHLHRAFVYLFRLSAMFGQASGRRIDGRPEDFRWSDPVIFRDDEILYTKLAEVAAA